MARAYHAYRLRSPAPPVRALRATIPARHPLLPARMRSLRSVSVILTSPPLRAGEVRITPTPLRTNCRKDDQSGITGGNPEPPRPRKNTAPVPGFSPDPSPASPKSMRVLAALMTVEGAMDRGSVVCMAHGSCKDHGSRRIDDRGRCKGRRASRGLHPYRRRHRGVGGASTTCPAAGSVRPARTVGPPGLDRGGERAPLPMAENQDGAFGVLGVPDRA